MNKVKLLPLLFLLILSACLLAGCGSGETETSAPAPEAQTAETPTEDLIYTARFREIPLDRNKNLEPLAFTEDGLYAVSWEEQEITDPAEGEAPVKYAQKLYYVNQNGQTSLLLYSGSPAPSDDEGKRDYSSGSNLQGLFCLENGEMLAVESLYASWYDGPENITQSDPGYWNYYQNENSFTLLRLDKEGRLISAGALDWDPDANENMWMDFRSAVLDGEGRIIVTGQQNVFVFSEEGSLLGSIEMDDWSDSPVLLRDGRVGVVSSGRRGAVFTVLDLEKFRTGDTMNLDDWPQRCYPGGGEYDFFYTSGMRLYGCKLADGSVEEVLDLLACDLSPEALYCLRTGEDGAFRGFSVEQDSVNLVELSLVPRKNLPVKRVLTLGILGSGDSMVNQVLRFNRHHDDVRIQVVDYSESFDDSAGDLDALTKLSTQIMAGDMPDLLALDSLPYEQLASKGLLEDLYPWLDRDPELKREDFLPTVLQSAAYNGGLYRIASGFQVYTLIGASSVVGEEPGWSFEQLEAALSTMPEGCTILGPTVSRDEMLMRCLYSDMGSYVDWAQGTCDFDSADFCKLLEFCASFPAEPDYASGSSDYGRAAAGQQLLLDLNVSSLDEVGYADQYFGGRVTYVGLPSRTGSGSLLMLANSFGMSAACADKESAWEFLRSFLLPDYQFEQYNLPLRKDVFDAQMEDAMRISYEMDENGQPRLDENGEKIPIARGGMGTASEDGQVFSFEFYGLTQEQADRFRAMLETAQAFPSFNAKVYEMVQNEAKAYFNGERSIEDTAKLIQTKVSLYLSEQS